MNLLKYTVIKTAKQYKVYCNVLEKLIEEGGSSKNSADEIELVSLLIETWDAQHFSLNEVDPIELLHSLMHDRNMKAKDLVELLGVSKGLVSDILNYKKGLSKEIIRILSAYFKVSQEAFNRPYAVRGAGFTGHDKTRYAVQGAR